VIRCRSLIALACVVVLQPALANSQLRTGELLVVSDPSGARVLLDGNDVDELTPFGPAQIPAGPHTVEIRLEGFAQARRHVTITPGLTTQLSITLSRPSAVPAPVAPPPAEPRQSAKVGSLKLGSEPTGAQVYLNREQRGATPLEIASLREGSYELRLELPGYVPHTGSVDIRGGETVQTITRLEPMGIGGGSGARNTTSTGAGMVVLFAVLIMTGGGLTAAIVVVKRRREVVIVPTPSRGVPIAEGALRFGEYQVVEKIASGGMANIYRAVHRSSQQQAVVKVPYEQFQNDKTFIERFRREAELGRKLHNENIVRIYEAGTTKDNLTYLAMEFIDGVDLRHAMGGLSVADTVDIVTQLGRALDYAHSKRVIHRDIKPENVMVTLSHPRRVVLMDFGIARAGFQGTIGTGSTYLGTPYYMAPEPANGKEPGPYSDLYSVGVMFFEMLVGRRPVEGDSPIAVLQQHVSAPPPSPRVVNSKVPPRLESIVVKLLAKRPEDRYQSAEQLIVELQDFARGGRT
jgi:tRNA A-37 threonylcarbamoyl transferase component Bud32